MVDPEDRVPENKVTPPKRQHSDPKAALEAKAPSQVPTTGHRWDGIEEYDNPMPRWWLWTFYATIAWGIVYTILFPAWPLLSRATPGLLGWSSRQEVRAELQRFDDLNADRTAAITAQPIAAVASEPDLNQFAVAKGAAVFRTWCAQCHGSGAAGAVGFPNLLDDDWMWGGGLEAVEYTIAHGIRNDTDADARYSQMPAFGEILEPTQIEEVVQHVLAISGQDHDAAKAGAGAAVFAENCSSCHGEAGLGDREQGAPNLTDAIWLYGGDPAALTQTVTYARFGVMPAWSGRLTEAEIRAVALYVHQLGGGE